MPVGQPTELVEDLRQLQSLISLDAPLSPERRLEPGTKVRIRTGPFAGFEGTVFRRDIARPGVGSRALYGSRISVAVEDCQLEKA